MRCDVCQTRLLPGQKECPNCGFKMPRQSARVNGGMRTESIEHKNEIREKIVEQRRSESSRSFRPYNQNRNREQAIIIGIVVVSVLLLFGLLTSIISRDKDSDYVLYPEMEETLEQKADEMIALFESENLDMYQDTWAYDESWGEIIIDGEGDDAYLYWKYEVDYGKETHILSLEVDSIVPLSKELLLSYEQTIKKIEDYVGRYDIYQTIVNEFEKVKEGETDYYYRSGDNVLDVELSQSAYSKDDYTIIIDVRIGE